MPVGLYREPERYDLRVQVLDASGEPYTAGGAEIFNKETFTRGFFPYEELGDGRRGDRASGAGLVQRDVAGDLVGRFAVDHRGSQRCTSRRTPRCVLDARKAQADRCVAHRNAG